MKTIVKNAQSENINSFAENLVNFVYEGKIKKAKKDLIDRFNYLGYADDDFDLQLTIELSSRLQKNIYFDKVSVSIFAKNGVTNSRNIETLAIHNRKIKITEEEKKKLLQLIAYEKINLVDWAKVSEVNYSKIHDVKRNRGKFSDQEYFSLKIALQKVRVNIKNSLEQLSHKSNFSDVDYKVLRSICVENLIVLELILAFKLSFSQRNKIRYFILKKSSPLNSDILQVIDCFAIFILETAL